MKEITHICDGCGRRHEGDDMPAMWKHIAVSIDSRPEDSASTKLTYRLCDLCDGCVDRLLEIANPTTWPRGGV